MKQSKALVTAAKFNVEETLIIADPCYLDRDDGDAAAIVEEVRTGWPEKGVALDGCQGDWIGEVVMKYEGSLGNRVESLRLTRLQENGQPVYTSYRERFERVGVNAVDSGQMYAGGAECLPLDYDRLLSGYNIDPSMPFGEDNYNYNNADCLAAEGGVVSSTGYGDGCYPVYVMLGGDDKPAVVEVRFLEELEDEEYED